MFHLEYRRMDVLKNLIGFAGSPDCKKAGGLDFGQRGVVFMKIVGWMLVANLAVGFMVQFVYTVSTLITEGVAGTKVPMGDLGMKGGILWFIIVTVVMAPLMEETMFRLPLTKFREMWLRLALSLLVAYKLVSIVFSFYSVWQLLPREYWQYMVVYYLSIGVCGSMSYLLLVLCDVRFSWVEVLWEKRFPIVFYCVTILFVLMHRYYTWWAVPSLAVSGFFLGFTRVRLGLGYSMVLHAAINAMSLLKFVMPGY